MTLSRFSVERRTVTLEGGRHLVREYVVHPGAVVILPILSDGAIVMIRQLRRGIDEVLWEFPAGTCETDESPMETARRELEEETGYVARAMEPLVEFYTSPGILTERMHAFVATGLQEGRQRLETGETIETVLRTPKEIRRMVESGEIRDGKTLAALGVYFTRENRSPIN